LGIKYSKIEGNWSLNNNDVEFDNLTHLKTMNSKLNTITNDNIAKQVKDVFGSNTTLITFKDSNGNCNANPFLSVVN